MMRLCFTMPVPAGSLILCAMVYGLAVSGNRSCGAETPPAPTPTVPPTAPAAPRPRAPEPGYCRFPGTISPDGAYEFAWAPAGLSPDVRASLKEWPRDFTFDAERNNADNFLFKVRSGRLAAQLPGFDFFDGQGSRKNRGDFDVGWSPDSRSAIAICRERWDDDGIAWVEPAMNRITDMKAALEGAYGKILHQRHKEDPATLNMQFDEPAVLPGNVLVVDGNAGHMKEGPYYHYRLVCRVKIVDAKAQIDVLKARMIPQKAERTTGVDYEPDLNTYYGRLRARLDEKGRATLKKEEEGWLKWRESQPEEAREQLTERRAVELRARVEMKNDE